MNQLRLVLVLCLMGAIPMMASTAHAAAEICDDSTDNDGDGSVDCDDDDCDCEPAKWAVEVCDDGFDNDLDNAMDCGDKDCRNFRTCRHEVCTNGVDDDGDETTDCDDSECTGKPACNEATHCFDGKDNDRNGEIDCFDDLCKDTSECVSAKEALAESKKRDADRLLQPYKVAAARKSFGKAKVAEAKARKVLAEDPTDVAAKASVGEAVATQIRLRKQVGLGVPAAPAPGSMATGTGGNFTAPRRP